MNKSILIGWISVVLVSGCINPADHSKLPVLAEADSLAETNPDSAYRLLTSIEEPEKLSERNFADWCLISGKTFSRRTDPGKAFLPSLYFERARQYYKQYGTTEQQAFIRLYWGRSYKETSEYDQAMQIYSETLKDAEAWQEYNAAGMICRYMGDLYQIQYLSDKCKEKYNESIAYFTLTNNQKRIAYAYAELGFEYLYDEKPEEGLTYLLQADSIAQSIQDSILLGDIYYSLGVAYNELNDFAAAEQSLLKALKFSRTKTDSITAYYALNSVYITSGDFQKARKTLDLGINKQTKDGILHQQYMIEKGEHHFEQALTYLEQYQQAIDSTQTEQKKMHTLEIEKKYNLEHTDNLKNKAQLWAQRNYIIALVAVAAALLILLIHQVLLRRKNRIILQQQENIRKTDQEIADAGEQLEQAKEMQQVLQKALNTSHHEISALLAEHQQRIDGLKKTSFEIKQMKIREVASIGVKVMKVAAKVTPGGIALSREEWKSLKELLQTTFPMLNAILWERPDRLTSLTETDLRHCMLAFYDLGAKGDAIIMNILPDSVYKQRFRLRQKLKMTDGTNFYDYFKAYCIEHE